MAITVQGIEVRAEEVNVETEFRFLTEAGQKRLFLENKEVFLLDALSSNFPAVRSLLWEPEVLETCSSAVLNKAISACCIGEEAGDIVTLINAVGSELSEHNIELIIYTPWIDVKIKALVAQNEKTSLQILKTERMFIFASTKLVQSGDCILFDAIVNNPNFELDEEIEYIISRFSPEGRKIIRQRIERLKKTD